MKHLALIALLLPLPVLAQTQQSLLETAVNTHIIPRYEQVTVTANALEQAALLDCALTSESLRAAYHAGFDAWIGVTHLRFGPSEVENRAFAMAFWPDKGGFTAKALNTLIAAKNPVVGTPEHYSQTSIAGRGYFALDMLLFDPRFAEADAEYTCRLIQAITTDISDVADAILYEWTSEYGAYLITAGSDTNPAYLTEAEGVQELFKAMLTGMEFTQAQRLARPMGSLQRPRPNRAEARRSDRSQRNITLALSASAELGHMLTAHVGGGLSRQVEDGLALSLRLAQNLNDPVLAGVSTINGRFRVEALQSSIIASMTLIIDEFGPALGVNPGFNALDGD